MLNLFQTMMVEEMLVEQEFRDAREKVRYSISEATGRKYIGFDKLYGGTNDEIGGYEGYDPTSDRPRDLLPYIPVTEQDENGFRGLIAPLG